MPGVQQKELVTVGDIVRAIRFSDENYWLSRVEQDQIYGIVTQIDSADRIRIAFAINSSECASNVHVHEWEIVSRIADESAEVTAWKTQLYAECLKSEQADLWCNSWRTHAPKFGFTEMHKPPKKMEITVRIPTSLRGNSLASAVDQAAKEFADSNNAYFISARLVD